jgi:hypothetical protein
MTRTISVTGPNLAQSAIAIAERRNGGMAQHQGRDDGCNRPVSGRACADSQLLDRQVTSLDQPPESQRLLGRGAQNAPRAYGQIHENREQ